MLTFHFSKRDEDHQPTATHTVRLESAQPFFYPPAFPDFSSLPFPLSTLLQKKKEMAAILVPRLQQQQQQQQHHHHHQAAAAAAVAASHHQTKLTLEHLSKAAALSLKSPSSSGSSGGSGSTSSVSPHTNKADNGNNTAVSEYEHQIQNDLWPLDCIKCTAVLPNLDNFNIHMNDHW